MSYEYDTDYVDESLGRAPDPIADPINEAINVALFGMTELEIIDHLGLTPTLDLEFRDHVSIYALDATNATLKIMTKRLQRQIRKLSTDEMVKMATEIANRVAPIYRAKAARDGKDYLSEWPLDKHGKALVMKQLRLPTPAGTDGAR